MCIQPTCVKPCTQYCITPESDLKSYSPVSCCQLPQFQDVSSTSVIEVVNSGDASQRGKAGSSRTNFVLCQCVARGGGLIEVDLLRVGTHWNSLGILLSSDGLNNEHLTIDTIDDNGLIPEFNAKSEKDAQVRKGDLVVAVNGNTGVAAFLISCIQANVQQGARLTLVLRRRV